MAYKYVKYNITPDQIKDNCAFVKDTINCYDIARAFIMDTKSQISRRSERTQNQEIVVYNISNPTASPYKNLEIDTLGCITLHRGETPGVFNQRALFQYKLTSATGLPMNHKIGRIGQIWAQINNPYFIKLIKMADARANNKIPAIDFQAKLNEISQFYQQPIYTYRNSPTTASPKDDADYLYYMGMWNQYASNNQRTK